MSAQPKPNVKPGATKGKLVLVAVLGLVLVGVLASNLRGGAAPGVSDRGLEGDSDGTAEAASAAGQAPGETTSSPFGEFATDVQWPALPLAEVVRFDPLAMPAWAGPPRPSKVGTGREFSAEELTELQNAENAIILVSGGKRVALIGTKEFQVGDMIGGLRISDISPQGIVLSEPE